MTRLNLSVSPEEEIQNLSKAHPHLHIIDLYEDVADANQGRRISAQRQAEADLPVAISLKRRFPLVASLKIGERMRTRRDGPEMARSYARAIAALLNASEASPKPKPKPKQPDAEGAIVLRPDSSGSKPDGEGNPFLSEGGANGIEATPDHRPYSFKGRFAGPVYKTGHASVGRFYDAIRDNAPMSLVADRAREILGNPGAKFAMNNLETEDRSIFL